LFPEDEFLFDSFPGSDAALTTLDLATPTATATKRKRGRPSKKSLAETSTPSAASVTPSFKTDTPSSEFATPTDGPKRGRKKKVDVHPLESPSTGLGPDSGKRFRKKIDYRELSGEVENPDASTNDANETSVDRSNETSVDSTLNGTTAAAPEKKTGRGKKRKIDVSTLGDSDASSTDAIKTSKDYACGKCEASYKTRQQFLFHVATAHGGVVSWIFSFGESK
jgi:hypothetical protein